MSGLVEKVQKAIAFEMNRKEDGWVHYEYEARAAIAAVAEWLDAYHKAEYLQSENHASPALRSALEAKP